MAVRAVDVQPGTRPLLQIGVPIARIGQLQRRLIEQGLVQHSDVRQRPNLVVLARIPVTAGCRRIAVVFVQLKKVERQRRTRPWIMAAQTLRATVEMPRLPAVAARSLCVRDLQHTIRACGVHEPGVGLLVVPLIRVAVPVDAVEMENLRFDATTALRFARLRFQRQRSGQNGV